MPALDKLQHIDTTIGKYVADVARVQGSEEKSTEKPSRQRGETVTIPDQVKTENVAAQTAMELTGDQVESLVKEMNGLMDILERDIQFTWDDKTKTVVVKVLDGVGLDGQRKVIRQIPPAQMLRMKARFAEIVSLLMEKYA